jgi:hypothetical protein
MKYYIGIDPGTSGGIAVLNLDGAIHYFTPMPETPADILDVLMKHDDAICCLERVWGTPGMGGASMFTFGQNFGTLQMALYAAGVSVDDITPQKWMKMFQLKKAKEESKTQWKNRLKAQAQQFYPNPPKKITLAVADALLIATYCYRTHKG